MAGSILRLERLTKRFGGLVAVDNVDFDLPQDCLHAIIGPNGAGKTTLFNLISGFLKASSGRVIFDDHDITQLKTHRISQLGIARSLQVKSVFSGMTVAENIWIAAQSRRSVFHAFRPARSFRGTQRTVARILAQMGLERFASREAGTLSYGDVALLEMGIALATEPRLLLLDEPVCGMSPAETEQTVAKIKELSKTVNIIIIEHDMEVVFEVADNITVMAQGRILAQGAPKEITENRAVREAYLGDPETEEDLVHA